MEIQYENPETNRRQSLLEADVVRVYRHHIRLRFKGGLESRASTGDYWDRWPECSRTQGTSYHVPNRIEVIVRRLDPRSKVINVSMHGYTRDDKYCNAAAGYRSTYEAQKGIFQRLPWERSDPR